MTCDDASEAQSGASSPSQLNASSSTSTNPVAPDDTNTASSSSLPPTYLDGSQPSHTVSHDQILSELKRRVVDWKGLDKSDFGSCVLHSFPMTVTRCGIDRPYYVIIFERIIICLKEQSSRSTSPATVMPQLSIRANGKKTETIISVEARKPRPDAAQASPQVSESEAEAPLAVVPDEVPPLERPQPECPPPLLLKGRIWMPDFLSVEPSYDEPRAWKGKPPKRRTGILPLTLHFQPHGEPADSFTLWFADGDQRDTWQGTIENSMSFDSPSMPQTPSPSRGVFFARQPSPSSSPGDDAPQGARVPRIPKPGSSPNRDSAEKPISPPRNRGKRASVMYPVGLAAPLNLSGDPSQSSNRKVWI
ncbi:hypothetical protein HGRIS_014671 [Hohenbuehelia grisea]|uniref:Uncharacterized protein n=1 Tax=Hohenbuehelia grisea TaxID=104357 RepID=A0ABR3JUF8_9AGAR